MLSAMPETPWLPWCVMQANPCTSPTSTAAAIPAASPAHAEPVTAAVAAAANAEASILPSSPMSTMPERSAKSPPSAASTSGTAPRAVAAASSAASRRTSLTTRSRCRRPRASAPGGRARRPAQERGERNAQRMLESAADEDDQPLDDHHHVARELRHVERELRAALIERAEQDRGDHDADGMVAAHQAHRDPDVAGTAGEIQEQPMLYAHELGQAHEAGQRARDRHRHDHGARGLDAAVDRGRLVVAQHAQLVTPARVPEVEPDEAADRQRQEQREIDRRAADLPADRSSQIVELRHPRARLELARLG